MDSNSSDYILNHATLSSVYYQGNNKDGSNFIDLGLSLRTLQPEAYYPSAHVLHAGGYDELIDWQHLHPQLGNNPRSEYPTNFTEINNYDDEAEGIQSKEKFSYVKVNMDGVIVGRKICILEHSSYSSLAIQLEHMFGKHSMDGLRLFQDDSEFSLFYKDRDEQWRTVGDVPWNEFADQVKRLRIVKKDEAFITNSSALLSSV
ncbi:auxin-responsive protein IAA32-like isoform X1 [Lycium ferocissimum]|uniref:auxin-responsive protein IAA32-like isoform X1 n=1 Tax=Lycium ferocissimum TaxID=112874 RepID=UPI002815ED10|nr:auxin-responsive protein IAA32-like isoform X1 [Lycium ferocissimum]